MRPSLRRRLMITLSIAMVAVWSAAIINTYVDTREELDQLLDAQLEQAAHVIMSLTQHELFEHMEYTRKGYKFPEHELPIIQKYTQKVAYQIWLNKKLVIQSKGAPTQALANRMGMALTRSINGEEWRAFALKQGSLGIQVHVGEHLDAREQVSELITGNLLFYLALGIPLIGMVIWVGVGHALLPLISLTHTVATQELENLHQVDASQVPKEILPLVQSLNDLFNRLSRAVNHMKNFTADAAHELRTPLAALRTHAQLALKAKDNQDNDGVAQQINEIISSVDRASYLIDQLLTMARVDHEEYHMADELVDVTNVAKEVITNVVNKNDLRHIDLSLETEQEMWVHGKAPMLEIMLQNIILNAVKHTPDNGSIRVDLYHHGSDVVLTVDDSGPGIDPSQRKKLFRRFYRDKKNTKPGIGLGLSIVKRIVDIHHGQVELLESPLGGLRVEICLRAVQKPRKVA